MCLKLATFLIKSLSQKCNLYNLTFTFGKIRFFFQQSYCIQKQIQLQLFVCLQNLHVPCCIMSLLNGNVCSVFLKSLKVSVVQVVLEPPLNIYSKLFSAVVMPQYHAAQNSSNHTPSSFATCKDPTGLKQQDLVFFPLSKRNWLSLQEEAIV